MVEEGPPDPGPGDQDVPSRGPWQGLSQAVGLVTANRNLRRIQLAFVGSSIGDWAYSTAVAVWAFQVGGTKAVGTWMAIRLTLMAVSAPVTSRLADTMPRKQLMVLCDLARALLITAAAACLYLDTPAAPVFVLATLTGLFGTPFMIAQRSLLPALADRPEELTAANGTASTIESLAFFAGPSLAAVLLGFTTVETVFLFNVATFVWSMVLVLGLTVPAGRTTDDDDPEDGGPPGDADGAAEPAGGGFLSETSAGFRAIAGDEGLLVVTAAACVQTVVAGPPPSSCW